MKSRVVVAAIGIVVIILANNLTWQQPLLFAVLVTVAAVFAILEYCEMMREHQPFVPAALLATAITPIVAARAYEPGIFAALLTVLPLTMIFAALSVPRREPAIAITATLAGVLYIAVPLGLAVVVRGSSHGMALIWLLLAGVWVTDTGAFFCGKALGRHKLAPRISPNKTIEGFVGGTVAGTLVVWYGHFLTDGWLDGGQALAIGLSVSLAATVGDLFESMLKRAVGVKDSSRLLGDHGGMLDRIDALLIAVPVGYVAAFLLGVT